MAGAVIVGGLGVLAGLTGLWRWLRVSQREHYITGSCSITAWRWIRFRPPNMVLAGVASAALLAGLGAAAGGNDVLASSMAGVVAVTVGVFPWPMSVIGRPRFRFTRRARTLAGSSLILSGLVAGGSAVGLRWPMALAVAVAAGSVTVDCSAAVLAPLENKLLERHRRRAVARLAKIDPFVIAVTGSWGKTSTKNHIRDLLTGTVAVVASPASYNNTAGLAKTINDHLPEGTDVLVVEMGMYRPGEIRDMCSWVRPDIAVITAVGPMHLERAGSMERIAAAKAEILEQARTAVLWVDDHRLDELSRSARVPEVSRVGSSDGSSLDVEVAEVGDTVIVTADGSEVGRVGRGSGVHSGNIGCAVAAALAYGATPAQIGSRIAALQAPPHRATTSRLEAGILVIDDTFNSNPDGAARAVQSLALGVQGQRVVVTPGMVELGSEQDRANAELARTVISSGATLLVVGWVNRRSLLAGSDGRAISVPNRSAARAWVREHLGPGDGVLWENDLPDHYP